MKFMLMVMPSLPATLQERRELRPVGHRTESWQRMFDEVVGFAQKAEDLGFDAMGFGEFYMGTEGVEASGPPALYLYVAMHTKRLRLGPIGYVLPAWDPVMLAMETACLDQLTKGRTFVGFARGFQHRMVNTLAQRLGVGSATSDQSELDQLNRRAFEEVYQILKLAWAEEPFRFKGEFYEYPYPHEGLPWPSHRFTREYGAPGEVDDEGWLPHTMYKRIPLKVGDSIYLEYSACYQRYNGPTMRSASVGKPLDVVKRLAEASITTLNLLIETIRPGRTSHEVAMEAKKGLAPVEGEAFFHGGYGYSIGMGFHPTWTEAPMYIAEGVDRLLEPGMTFHLPICIAVPGRCGVGFSESVAVTETGCEVLTPGKERELAVCPA